MKKYDYLVVGAGLYGAVFAQKAHAAGKSVLVIDKRPNTGGNVYTEDVEGRNTEVEEHPIPLRSAPPVVNSGSRAAFTSVIPTP